MDGLFGDGLVDVLCCGGDSLDEGLHWGPRLGALVDLVEFVDGVTSCGVTLFKTVYSEVVPDWLILNSDLYGTIHDCGPLRTHFDNVVVLAVVALFFVVLAVVALFSRSIGFQIFGNLKDSPLI